MNQFNKIFLLGVGITNAKEIEVLEFITTSLQSSGKKIYIVTPNPELIVIAHTDKKYKSILNNADLALPDGVGVMWGAKLLGKPLAQRITGVDFTESLCNWVSKQPITVSFMGAGPGVADKAAKCLKEKYKDLNISWVSQDWDISLKSKKVDILFVALGSPKQEFFIHDNLNNLPAKVVIGVGGTFDFISGQVPRAPKVFQKLGIEWIFRLFIQPWRIKRQLSLIKFIFLVFKQKFINK